MGVQIFRSAGFRIFRVRTVVVHGKIWLYEFVINRGLFFVSLALLFYSSKLILKAVCDIAIAPTTRCVLNNDTRYLLQCCGLGGWRRRLWKDLNIICSTSVGMVASKTARLFIACLLCRSAMPAVGVKGPSRESGWLEASNTSVRHSSVDGFVPHGMACLLGRGWLV